MSKNAGSPGRIRRSLKTCGCGEQRSPEIALTPSTYSDPRSYRVFGDEPDGLVLAHARPQELVQLLVGGIHHRRRLREQADLVLRS